MTPINEAAGTEAAMSEVRRLRAEIANLKEKLEEIHGKSDLEFAPREEHPWLRIAATVGVTFALGKLIRL